MSWFGKDDAAPAEVAPEKQEEKKEKPSSKKSWARVGDRVRNAFKEAHDSGPDSNFFVKSFNFLAGFLADSEKLETEEEAAAREASEDITKNLLALDDARPGTMADMLTKQLVGDAPLTKDSEEEVAISSFSTIAVNAAKEYETKKTKKGAETVSAITRTVQKMNPAENKTDTKLTNVEKKLISGYGLQVLVNIKKTCKDRAGFEKFMANLDKATEKGLGTNFLKSPEFYNHILSVFKKAETSDGNFLTRMIDKVDNKVAGFSDFEPVINKLGMSVSDGEKLGEQLATEFKTVPLTNERAEKLADSLDSLFHDTPKGPLKLNEPNRARALQIISEISAAKASPTNAQISELVFSIDTRDFERLIDALKC